MKQQLRFEMVLGRPKFLKFWGCFFHVCIDKKNAKLDFLYKVASILNINVRKLEIVALKCTFLSCTNRDSSPRDIHFRTLEHPWTYILSACASEVRRWHQRVFRPWIIKRRSFVYCRGRRRLKQNTYCSNAMQNTNVYTARWNGVKCKMWGHETA